MIMRLDLETDVISLVKPYDTGIVLEDGYAPRSLKLLCRLHYRLFKEIIYAPFLSVRFIIDKSAECFMSAVFGPCLRQCLELDIGRIPPESRKIFLNTAHLG